MVLEATRPPVAGRNSGERLVRVFTGRKEGCQVPWGMGLQFVRGRPTYAMSSRNTHHAAANEAVMGKRAVVDPLADRHKSREHGHGSWRLSKTSRPASCPPPPPRIPIEAIKMDAEFVEAMDDKAIGIWPGVPVFPR